MQTNRRDFLRKAGALSVGLGMFPAIVPSSALGRSGQTAPSDRLKTVLIGAGGMGRGLLNGFLNQPDIQAIAVCDVDRNHIDSASNMVNSRYENTDCRGYVDFRELLDREEIDVAILGLPDHWHAIISCAVADKKIDIYGEKPLTRYLAEGRAVVRAVERNNIVWQTGSQQRSENNFHHACELVRNGRIGRVDYVEVGLPDGGHYIGNPAVQPVPEHVDWDLWLGPAPKVPYRGVLHGNWRWIMDYSGGQLTDWAGHHIDIAHWGLGLDNTGPQTIEGSWRVNADGLYDVPAEYDFTCEYAQGVTIRVASASKLRTGMGAMWRGTDGWIHVRRGGLEASDPAILQEQIGENEERLIRSRSHIRNFIDAVKSRGETIAPVEAAHRSLSVAHLGMIAMQLGQKLHWDPVAERFTDNNVMATRLLRRAYREPWTFPE